MPNNDYEARVDDLALFFRTDDGSLGRRWIPHDVYADPKYELDPSALPTGWEMNVFSEQEAPAGGRYYVANLALLLPPGSAISDSVSASMKALKQAEPLAPNDIVIVPWRNDGRLVPHRLSRKVYTNDAVCPEIGTKGASDLSYMAVNEGVVLANMPKPIDLQGFTCYLLSLVSLRSGALHPSNATFSKTEVSRATVDKLPTT